MLDHAPRWQAEQRQAFRDWLWRGGTVVLVSGPDGQQPHFGPGLDFLDQPGDRLVLGAGQVLRLDATAAQLTAERLKAAGAMVPALHTDDQYFQPLGSRLFRQLSELVRPHHPWGTIYVVLIFYLLIIGLGA